MKLTRHEIVLLIVVMLALAVGGFVKRFRDAHPVISIPEKPISKK